MAFSPAKPSLKVAVIATLAFFDIFDKPLTIDDIQTELLWTIGTHAEIWPILNEARAIQRYGDYYFLKGRREIVDRYRINAKFRAKLWQKVTHYRKLFTIIPFVRMAAVCNSLAMGSGDRESDIDLFIITKKGRLNLVRFLTVIFFWICGVKRHGKKISGKFCLSFYCDDNTDNLESIKRKDNDIYLSYWLKTLQPIYGKNYYQEFIDKNHWLRKSFPSFSGENHQLSEIKLNKLGKLLELVFRGILGDRLDTWLGEKQKLRHEMNRPFLTSKSDVIVNDSMLKFHNHDRRDEIIAAFNQRMEILLREI